MLNAGAVLISPNPVGRQEQAMRTNVLRGRTIAKPDPSHLVFLRKRTDDAQVNELSRVPNGGEVSRKRRDSTL